ncbi:hypothetical protein MKX08_002314 [Trichoderma sp. CBMAI-0020]|nr:hypothetical protein MKX08_002314 [Trichoderma sp. CBMAI-0020]
MCPIPGSGDLQARINSFPNNLKFVHGVDNARLQGGQTPWVWGRDDAAAACCLGCPSESVFCCCYSYSRAWTRLEIAASGRDATNIPEIRNCNCDCAGFALGFPFYAFCLGSLQRSVRRHYGIDGDDCQDYCDACCSPRRTLVRAEGEIIFREQGRNGNQGDKVDDTQYLCYDQMAYPVKQAQLAPAVRLQAVPRPQAAPRVQASPGQVQGNPYQYAVQVNAQPQLQPPRAPIRRPMHTLEDDFATASTAKQHDHALGDDMESAALTVPTPHDLGATSPRPVPVKNETGALLTVDSPHRSLDSHELYFDAPLANSTQVDAIVHAVSGGSGHPLEADKVMAPIASFTRLHQLGQ